MKNILLVATLFAAVIITRPHVAAQQPAAPQAQFEVSSVKRNTTEEGRAGWDWQPGGRFTMLNTSVLGLIDWAYPSKLDPSGAPDWVKSERYDVDARATFDPTPDQQMQLLRGLLADRFKFTGHYQGQPRSIYALVLARPGQPAPALHHIDIDCATWRRDPSAPLTPSGLAPCAMRTFTESRSSGLSITSGGRTIQQLGDSLSAMAGRPVVDKTGLPGYYAYTLQVMDKDLSVFTAVQEQLGLKLESSTGSLDGIVIDHIERPTED